MAWDGLTDFEGIKGSEEAIPMVIWERAFQEEGTESAKALRLDQAWHVCGIARNLDQSERGGQWEEVRAGR